MTNYKKPKVLVFIVAYQAESTILDVINRIPKMEAYESEVLLIDDCSKDRTFRIGMEIASSGRCPHPLTVLRNPVNQGYGGNQKIGYQYALTRKFDIVALLHGDGQYPPELLPELFKPISEGQADVVLGSRMLIKKNALKGGMPFYKFIGNQVLTSYQNFVLGTSLSEFHTGYKAYSTTALRSIPFALNSNVFHFDTEILIQFFQAKQRIQEIPIPTHYGKEICRVNGFKYALDVVRTSTASFLQRYGLVYRRNFDVESIVKNNKYYHSKLDFLSTHSEAVKEIWPGSTVMDIGCGPGHLCQVLKDKRCRIIGVDKYAPDNPELFDEFRVENLDEWQPQQEIKNVQVILILDIIEHLISPEHFCEKLREVVQENLGVKIIISTGNIGYFIIRLMLLLGQFNYNKKGILDLTHTRLFTFGSLRRLMTEMGFIVESEIGIPAPIPLVIKSRWLCSVGMLLQECLIALSRGLFSYQMMFIVRPMPTLATLLKQSATTSTA